LVLELIKKNTHKDLVAKPKEMYAESYGGLSIGTIYNCSELYAKTVF
jgi:hypothetical protein